MVWANLSTELTALNWPPARVEQFVHHARRSTNQAAFVIQTLRTHMGNVRGARQTLDEMVFTSRKMAVVICVLLIQARMGHGN